MLNSDKIESKQSSLLKGELIYEACDRSELTVLLSRFGMSLEIVNNKQSIPGSYWGDSEAGLVNNKVLVRVDTPVHSILHEACHYICMDRGRREQLNTDAGGDYDEENGVCYLQILLSGFLKDMGRERMFADMDSWGYTFRLGSASRWFHEDASDAKDWLIANNIISIAEQPTGNLRNEVRD